MRVYDGIRPNLLTAGWAAVLAVSLTATGCTARFYREQADRDTGRIIRAKQQEVVGTSYPLDIEPAVPLGEELGRRKYQGDLPAGATSSASGSARPRIVAAGPRDPASVVQLSALFVAQDIPPPVGAVVDGADASEGTGPQPATSPATQPADAAAEQVDIPPIAGGEGLYVEPGRWPGDVRPIDLMTALRLASAGSREFQNAKESVYLSALSLTGQQHAFEMQFFGTVDSKFAHTDQRTRSGQIDSKLGFNRSFTTGGAMALSVSNTLFQVFTDPTGKRASSALDLALSQPLLRGAGFGVAAEPLIQADRNVTYAVRTFERQKRSLAVAVATEFYRVLQQGDQVINERNNYTNLIRARRRTEELAKAGRLPEFQVDQARQDELRARNRWLVAAQRYNQSVDEFRRRLGVPTDWPVVPDPGSLGRLMRTSLGYTPPPVDQAVQSALNNRLDLKTRQDELADAARKVRVAADALKMGLDVSASVHVPSHDLKNKPTDFRFEHGQYSIGAMMDFPLDRVNERNTYRSALVSLNRSQRALTEQIDQVAQEVRQALRNLVRARNAYQIQDSALKLAQRRVDSTNLLLQAGRASTRDVLEAQAALVEAQNALTAAMVDYHVARLEFLRDMETLQVEPAGLTYHDPTTE